MIAVRDEETLNILYPPENDRFFRLISYQEGGIIGWAVVLDSQMDNHKQFGNMRIGSIIDCLALPDGEYSVIRSATTFLVGRGVDMIVSNQCHHEWGAALKVAGFLQGPSNFFFTPSPHLADLIAPFDQQVHLAHLNRGDGDGPIHL